MKPPAILGFSTYILVFALLSACQNKASEEAAPARGARTASSTEADIAAVEAGIVAHIARQSEAGEGYFYLEDENHSLRLRLVRVHTEYLAVLGEGRFFACVDLADRSGDVYDVDFFMAGTVDSMVVTETTIHKLNGKPYYTWRQKADKTWERQTVEASDQSLLGVVEGEDHFDFFYQARIPALSDSAQMWLPRAQSNAFQEVELLDSLLPGRVRFIRDDQYGNGLYYCQLGPEDSGAELRLHYRVQRRESGPYAAGRASAQRYLGASPLAPLGGQFKQELARALQGQNQASDLVKARAIYDYIVADLRYAKQGTYGTGDAQFACDSRSGNCTEFHSFFISLARTAGIPARFRIGAALPSERDEGGMDGYHCWAEFFAEDKWWPVDLSEGNKYSALASYYFGHQPANRFELSRGRDLRLEPAPAAGRLPFLAFPYLEAGARVIPVATQFRFRRHKSPSA